MEELKRLISADEQILWAGTPSPKCRILRTLANSAIPAVLTPLLYLLALPRICGLLSERAGEIVHTVGFWVMLAVLLFCVCRVAFAALSCKKTAYLITNAGAYTKDGFPLARCEMLTYEQMGHITLHNGLAGMLLGCGTIRISNNRRRPFYEYTGGIVPNLIGGLTLSDLSDYTQVLMLLKNYQSNTREDIQNKLVTGASLYNTVHPFETDAYGRPVIPDIYTPYHKNEYYDLVEVLAHGGKLAANAIIMCEHSNDVELPDNYGPFKLVRRETYGGTIISIYRDLGEEGETIV